MNGDRGLLNGSFTPGWLPSIRGRRSWISSAMCSTSDWRWRSSASPGRSWSSVSGC